MKALYVRHWGASDAAVIEDIEKPSPAAGEILVRVRAVSINPLDWKIREGYLAEYLSAPLILGSDLAGDVEALGEGVTGIEPGTAVYGFKGMRGGAFAEYTTVLPNDIAPKPSSLSYAEAASVPHAAVTAWTGLFTLGNLQAGQRVLIHAAAGGVGHFAVQFAKNAGAYVIGTASAANEAYLRELGVDEFIDYQAASFENQVKDVDLVLDTVGFDTSVRSIQVLKTGGILVCIVTPPPMEAAAERQVTAHYAGAQGSTSTLTEIAQLIDAGKVKPHLHASFPFSRIQDALSESQTGHARGKIVVTIGD
jgi:NADPH:quinone reductase-like Zn-dependent oxidoreductase